MENNDLYNVSRAKLRLALTPNMMFTSSLCASLETVLTDEVPYGATDGDRLLINPKTFNQLTENEQVFLLAHETLHVAYLHTLRREHRDPELFNIACDYVINLQLVNQGLSMIQGGLLDHQYRDMNAEQVYELLENCSNLPKDIIGNDIIPSASTATNEVIGKIIQAVHQAEKTQNYGSIPENVKRLIHELHTPKVDWKVILKRFMLNAGKSDYTWNKPNRRMLHQGMYLPSINSFGLSKITFAIDTSGSVNDEMFTQFISDISHVFKQLNPNEIDLMLFDTEVKTHKTIHCVNELKQVKFTGYGGTDVIDVIHQFNKTNSKALIVITDGYFNTHLPKPNKDTLWIIYDNDRFIAPFGKVIHMEI